MGALAAEAVEASAGLVGEAHAAGRQVAIERGARFVGATEGLQANAAQEGRVAHDRRARLLGVGVVVFGAAKILKLWAIASLGRRWSYRVLVLPAAPLISTGPYARVRHPNYAAVLGEIAGFALITGARITGVLSLIVFSLLLRKRIATEERALGL